MNSSSTPSTLMMICSYWLAANMLVDYSLPVAHQFYRELGYSDESSTLGRNICGFILAHKKETISSREIKRKIKSIKNEPKRLYSVMGGLKINAYPLNLCPLMRRTRQSVSLSFSELPKKADSISPKASMGWNQNCGCSHTH